MMNKNDIERAVESIDGDLIDSVSEARYKNYKKRKRATRVRFTALIAAVLALAVSIPMIAVFANKAPEPETPVVAVTTEETKEEAKTPVTETPVETPTQKETEIQPTETQVEPTPTETPIVTPTPTETPIVTPTPVETETPVVTPTPYAQPTETASPTETDSSSEVNSLKYYADPDHSFWFDVADDPYIAVRITEITDNSFEYGPPRLGLTYTEVKYEVLCCCGFVRDLNTDTSELMKTLPPFFVLGSQPDSFQIGDIVICDVVFHSYGSAPYGDEIVVRSRNSFVPIKNGVLYDRSIEEGGNDRLYSTYKIEFQKLKNKIKNGYEVVNKELFDRMPDVDIQAGTSVEDFIKVMVWFSELRKVAVITPSITATDCFEVII